jgi:hypothetical protein
MWGPRGVNVKECCAAAEVGALGEVIIEDGFEDGDPGVGVLWRLTIEDEGAEVAKWFTFKK